MEIVKVDMGALGKQERRDSWRSICSKMIHTVEVSGTVLDSFSAEMTVRKHDTMSCGLFWSQPHRVRWGRARLSDPCDPSYLVSWQIEGEAHIEHGNQRLIQPAGSVAIVDTRHPTSVTFPVEVRRIVARLPARTLELRMPQLLTSHLEVFQPAGPFAPTLLSYLNELSRDALAVSPSDVEALVENVCNLLKVTHGPTNAPCDARELRRQALVSYLRKHACDPALSLDLTAAQLNMSRRLVQQLLQGMNTSFTQFIIEQRLGSVESQLARAESASISQIAYSNGFNDISHFNYLFKRKFGVAPSEYRDLSRETKRS
ncbi:helix-turn-helix domain-containing protein [Ottowia thiooxydans]|uniref:helix-turn-helix domain-containing protein n=1 Tax=Ottowia thiooxydans TaxID=219182 RepID=UPI0012EC6629|nr:AraC family transcriptional regulator [Ottowia thiooxydans]